MKISGVVTVAVFASFCIFLVSGGPAPVYLESLQIVSSYPYTDTDNGDVQHLTACEADTLSDKTTVVVSFQVGRANSGGAAGVGFATSGDGGRNWLKGVLPGQCKFSGNNDWTRVTDPTVGYSKRNNTWFIATLPFNTENWSLNAVGISRSTNGGRTWSLPTYIGRVNEPGASYDKEWIGCDNFPGSPYYGNCYISWDDYGIGNVFYMSTSTDGGVTWSPRVTTPNRAAGIGVQPVILPNGVVVMIAADTFMGNLIYWRSTNGGKSWTSSSVISSLSYLQQEGNLRTSNLPAVEFDLSTNTIYVAWYDCRFVQSCLRDDIVYVTSKDGINYSAVKRVPLNPPGGTADFFMPGIAVQNGTIAVSYFYYPNAFCGDDCLISTGIAISTDAGVTWSQPLSLVRPYRVNDACRSGTNGMLGDYISVSFTSNRSVITAFAAVLSPKQTFQNSSVRYNQPMLAARVVFGVPRPPTPTPSRSRTRTPTRPGPSSTKTPTRRTVTFRTPTRRAATQRNTPSRSPLRRR